MSEQKYSPPRSREMDRDNFGIFVRYTSKAFLMIPKILK